MYRTPQPDHLYEWDECIGFLSLLIPSLPRSLCATHYSPTLNPDEASRDLASMALRWLAPKPRGRTAGSGASDHLQDEPFILRGMPQWHIHVASDRVRQVILVITVTHWCLCRSHSYRSSSLANSSRRMTCSLHARVWWDVIRPKLLHELAVRVRALSGKCQNRYWISQPQGSFPF